MKKIHKKLLSLSLLTAVAIPAGIALAQDTQEEKPEACPQCQEGGKKERPDAASRFAELDADKDGKVTEAEVIQLHQKRVEEMAKAHFARMDLDENGVVTETEMKLVTDRIGSGPGPRGMRPPQGEFHGRTAPHRGHREMHPPRQQFRGHDSPGRGPRGMHAPRPEVRRGGDRFDRGGFARHAGPRGGGEFHRPRPAGRPEGCECGKKGPGEAPVEKKAEPEATPKPENADTAESV